MSDPRKIIDDFHRLFYKSRCWRTSWLGTITHQNPIDMWMLQLIIYETRPELIIETGTSYGGSSLFMATICDLIGSGKVITVDRRPRMMHQHPRVTQVRGPSTSEKITKEVRRLTGGSTKCMVFLDSSHDEDHVHREMLAYEGFVGVGMYLVVADTNLQSLVPWKVADKGPMAAVEKFLEMRNDFVSDERWNKFLFSFFQGGWLKRVGENHGHKEAT